MAGKTGTTQDNADGWFILMHLQLVAVACMGFDDGRVILRSDYWGQGAHRALIKRLRDWLASLLAPEPPAKRPLPAPQPPAEVASEPALSASAPAELPVPEDAEPPASAPAEPASEAVPVVPFVPFVPNSSSDVDRGNYGGR